MNVEFCCPIKMDAFEKHTFCFFSGMILEKRRGGIRAFLPMPYFELSIILPKQNTLIRQNWLVALATNAFVLIRWKRLSPHRKQAKQRPRVIPCCEVSGRLLMSGLRTHTNLDQMPAAECSEQTILPFFSLVSSSGEGGVPPVSFGSRFTGVEHRVLYR
jgi:hypothetical protein